MVTDLTSRFQIRFRRQDIEPTIDLKCISIDDLRIELFRQFDSLGRLADGGGTHQKKYITHREIVGQPFLLPMEGHAVLCQFRRQQRPAPSSPEASKENREMVLISRFNRDS